MDPITVEAHFGLNLTSIVAAIAGFILGYWWRSKHG